MARPISYDNVGFFSFAIALLSLVLVPFTLVKVRNLLRSCCGGATKRKKKSKGPTWLPVLGSALGWCFVVVGWFILIQMTRQVVGTSTEVFDPHEILGVSTSASARNIKKAYRKLSLTAHPDKGGDPVLFTQVVKAYETLTDEKSMDNWRKYGHPDGPRSLEVGIALPAFLQDESNEKAVLIVYLFGFILGFPSVLYCCCTLMSAVGSDPKVGRDTLIAFQKQLAPSADGTPAALDAKALALLLSSSEEAADAAAEALGDGDAAAASAKEVEALAAAVKASGVRLLTGQPKNQPAAAAAALLFGWLLRDDPAVAKARSAMSPALGAAVEAMRRAACLQPLMRALLAISTHFRDHESALSAITLAQSFPFDGEVAAPQALRIKSAQVETMDEDEVLVGDVVTCTVVLGPSKKSQEAKAADAAEQELEGEMAGWWCIVGASSAGAKRRRLVDLRQFPKAPSAEGERVVALKFRAPKSPGKWEVRIDVASGSCGGLEQSTTVVVNVKPMPEEEDVPHSGLTDDEEYGDEGEDGGSDEASGSGSDVEPPAFEAPRDFSRTIA